MLLPVNNAAVIPVLYNKDVSCKGRCNRVAMKPATSNNVLTNKFEKFNFRALFGAVAKLFGRECKFDESGKLVAIEKYVNNELIEKKLLFTDEYPAKPERIYVGVKDRD